MESKRTQLLNDALEMTKLVLQSTQANGEQLEKTDLSLTGLGQDVTALNRVADEILAQEKEHNDVLNGIKDNQQIVSETNTSLLETANSLTEVFDNNNETLTTIEETLANGRERDKETKDAFINEMSKKNETYGESVGLLFKELTGTKQTLEELNTHDELAELLESVNNVATSVKDLEGNREKHQEELMEQFGKTESDIQTSITSLDNLSTHADQLITTFETAVSRIKTIELKINALSDDSDDFEESDAEVAIDTQNQDTEGE